MHGMQGASCVTGSQAMACERQDALLHGDLDQKRNEQLCH